MNKVVQAAYGNAKSMMSGGTIPKTVQELKALCQTRPDHPVSKDILAAVAFYTDDVVCHVLPISIEALTTNRRVVEKYTMQQIPHPVTGKLEYKKLKTLELGESLERKEKTEEVKK